MTDWAPLRARQNSAALAAYETLREGVPAAMTTALLQWLRPHFVLVDDVVGEEHYRTSLLQDVQVRLDLNLEWFKKQPKQVYFQLQELMRQDEKLMLDVVDYLLAAHTAGDEYAEWLSEILDNGRSVWRVAESPIGLRLERRLDPTASEAVDMVVKLPGKAAEHLHRAWTSVYGQQTNPSYAYSEAIKAVEAAAKLILLPKDPVATMGKMLRAIQDSPSKWTTSLGAQGTDAVLTMMQAMWGGQTARHGDPDTKVASAVSSAEAEAALLLSLVLVHWFEQGIIRTAKTPYP